MVQLVNGVEIFETGNVGIFEETIFQLAFEDRLYFNKTIKIDLFRVNVIDVGPKWIYVIKDIPYKDYLEDKARYMMVMGEVHNRIIPFLKEMYGVDEKQILLGDHEDVIYGCKVYS